MSITRHARRLTVAVLLVLPLTACSGGGRVAPLDAEPVATTEVAVLDNVFEPVAIEVPVGAEVTWTWEGRQRHDVVGEGLFTELQVEGTYRATFDQPGIVTYTCTIHRGMDGVVHVVEG